MGKGANNQLLSNSGVAQSRSGQLAGNANAIYGPLTSTLWGEANNPQGYTPQQMAYMNTANQQSLGGSVAGITGQSNLQAARSRNAGGFEGAVGSGSRAAMRQLSQNAVGIQAQQANLQQAQRQQALSALQQLYGLSEQDALQYLNSSNSALNYENQGSVMANNDFWKSVGGIEGLATTFGAPGVNAATGGAGIGGFGEG